MPPRVATAAISHVAVSLREQLKAEMHSGSGALLRRVAAKGMGGGSFRVALRGVASEEVELRVVHEGRELGGDFYNAPRERRWNPRDATLFFDFRVLHDPRDVEMVVCKLGPSIEAGHLTGALTRLRQIQQAPLSGEFMQHLTSLVTQRKGDFCARHFAATWLGLARLGWQDAAFYDALARDSMKRNFVEAYTPVDLSNLIYAVGLLQKRHEQHLGMKLKPRRRGLGNDALAFPAQKELLQTLVRDTLVASHPARLNEVQLVSVVYGLGLAKFSDEALLGNLLRQTTTPERLRRFTEGELTNALYGMVLLGMERSDEAVQSVVDQVTRPDRLRRVAEHELTCLMYALRLLQYDAVTPLHNIREELVQPERRKRLSEQSLSMILSNMRYLGMTEATCVGPLLREIASDSVRAVIKPQGLAMGLYNYASSEFRDTEVLDALVQEAMKPKHMDRFTPNDLSNIMFALSAVRYENVEALEPLRKRLADPEVAAMFEPAHMANIFYGSGKLGFAEAVPYTLDEIMKPAKVHRMTSPQLVNVIYGLGQIAFQDHACVDQLLTEILTAERLRELTANQMAMMVSSLGRMGYKNLSNLTTIMKEITQPSRISTLSAIGLSSALHGLAAVAFRDPEILGAFLKEVILPSRLPKFQSAQLSILVYSLGKIGVEDARVLKPILNEIMQEGRMETLNIQGLTNILHGLSQLQQFDQEIWERLTAEISKPERLERLKALEMSLILYACGMKRWNRPVLKEITKRAQMDSHIKDFTTIGLASTLYSLAQLEVRDEGCVDKLSAEFCQPQHLEGATSHHLANVVFSLGAMNHRNKEVMQQLSQEIMKPERIPSFSRHGLYNLIFGFGRLQYRHQSLLENLWKEMLKLERLAGYTEREWATIASNLDTLKFKNEETVIQMRTKILHARGLQPDAMPRIHSKHELSPQDIKEMREKHQAAMQEALLKAQNPVHASQRRQARVDRAWLDEKNVIETKSTHLQQPETRTTNWRDRSHPATYPPRDEATYMTHNTVVGPNLFPRESPDQVRKKRTKAVRPRQVMVFNQSREDFSDDEMQPPPPPMQQRQRGERRERVISPWTSPYYNLRAVQWPKSSGPARTVNADFEEEEEGAAAMPAPAAPTVNPYEQPDDSCEESLSEDEFVFEEDKELPPGVSFRPEKPPSEGSFKKLMQDQKQRVRQKDQEAMDLLVQGLTSFAQKTKQTPSE